MESILQNMKSKVINMKRKHSYEYDIKTLRNVESKHAKLFEK